jgi:hypothetical protein
MKELSESLVRTIESAEPILRQVTASESNKPIVKGGWSRKQVIGHLIDSASNNHRRFVRAALQGSLEFPKYDQDGCVRVQAVQNAPWLLLVALWKNYNLSRACHRAPVRFSARGSLSDRRQRSRDPEISCRGLSGPPIASPRANWRHDNPVKQNLVDACRA